MDERTEHLRAHLPDRYEIVREHGRGGMAVVYLAIDRKHDREVALKVLAPELTAGIGAERFVREIQIAAHLNHPHILPLLDSGVADGLPYYVMPFVEGESLRERLTREEPLSVHDAVRIARDVAEALVYAHGHDLVHRDIKPGNILLTEGGAVVTDFGIAAAVDQLPEDHLTRTGLSVGSAGYMSPEQATGERELDGRADQYSLACVLFEMLAGRPPFTGRNARAILSRQLTEPAPLVSALRDGVPQELDGLLDRALALEPKDRFATTREFEAALEELAHLTATGIALRFRTRPAIWVALSAAVTLAGISWFVPFDRESSSDPRIQADTTTYAIFPFRYDPGVDVPLRETLRLRAGLSRWQGISPVDEFQLREAMERTGMDFLTTDQAARIALEKNAARFFMGQVVPVDDSISVHGVLYEIGPDGRSYPLASHDIRLSRSLTRADSLFTDLATSLLWHGSPPAESPDAVNTRSLGAWQAFDYGMGALQKWELARADSGFQTAVTYDDDYPDAYLWLALVRAWAGVPSSRWELVAEQAAIRADRLTNRDAAMAEALVLQARGQFGAACPLWDALTPLHPNDFAVWYGLASCLSADDVVVADDRSPTGWRFRSSRQRAIEAYREAFSKLPSILESFSANSYLPLRERLLIEDNLVLRGQSATDSSTYLGFPTWMADTLAFWMRPDSLISAPVTPDETRRRHEAIRRQRLVFREVASNWASHAPRSGPAREALAIALALSGDPAALDTLRQGRELTEDSTAAVRLAGLEAWFLVAFGLPNQPNLLERARSLADSVLHSPDAPRDPATVVGLAVLTGRGLRAARVLSEHVPESLPPHPAVGAEAARLLMFAAMGGPADSLDQAGRDLIRKSETSLRPDARDDVYRWLGLPASLAFPAHPLVGMDRSRADYLVAMQLTLVRGDSAGVRAALDAARERRSGYTATFDALYVEAALWSAIGEPETAIEWLGRAMSELPEAPDQMAHPERMAALMRATVLRAEASLAIGDSVEARRWARSLTILWSDADAFLQPMVARMRRVADCEPC